MQLNRIKRQFLSRVGLVRFSIFFVLAGLVYLAWMLFKSPASIIVQSLQTTLPESNGRTNMLLLGRGGAGHDAPDLTDTIFVISAKKSTGQTTFISLPRDLWVPSLAAKINSAYHYGVQKQGLPAGLTLAKSSVSEVTGLPVHFALVLDFSTFARAIDLVGGIDVNVQRPFDDYQYPIAGKENDDCGNDPEYKCRFEHISFRAGPAHMDGATALKFVRSRKSSGDEGTDFARSTRQAQVISAFRARLLSPQIINRPGIYLDLYQLFSSSVITDIDPKFAFALFKLALQAKNTSPSFHAVSEPDQLYHPPLSPKYQNQWILLPKNNDPRAVIDYISGLLD